jgi:predicted O-methyltransferase YrrM
MPLYVTHPDVQRYAEEHTTQPGELLQKIDRDTNANVLMPRMLSGKLQGRWLASISAMINPTYILEIGTFTGYATLCLAEGLRENGKIITIDINEELENRVQHHFNQSVYKNQIDYRIGDARNILPTLRHAFDLVFIDADKKSNALYYDLIFDKVRTGGWIVIDNVLWSGKVAEANADKDTTLINDFNKKIVNDARVNCVLLPLRDGVMIVQKK